MENIYEINNDFNFEDLSFENPKALAGGSYFSKISVGKYNKDLYLQLPKCLTKQGFLKNNTKSYTDLLFNTNKDNTLAEWFEKLEEFSKKKILSNNNLWFQNDMTEQDIEEVMNPIIRSYKSGKNFLIRSQIKLSKFKCWDENDEIKNVEDIKLEDELIPLISIEGIRFTSKSIQFDINLIQVMILVPQLEIEKICLIKKKSKIENTLEKKEKEEKEEEKEEKEESREKIDNIFNKVIEEKSELKDIEEAKEMIEEKESKESKETKEIKESKDTNDINILQKDKFLESLEDSCKNLGENLEEVIINLDDSEKNEDNEKLSLKNPREVYLEIYKSAKKKAKELRNNSIKAYLEAKSIKSQYNLTDLEDSEDEIENENENENEKDDLDFFRS